MSNNVLQIVIQAVDKGVKAALAGVRSGLEQTNKASQSYHQTLQSLNGTADHFRSTMAGVIATLGGAQLFAAAGRGAVQFNSTIEQSRIGIAALIRAFAEADGGSVGMAESMQTAADIQKQLQLEGLKTTATYEQLLKALQEGLGPALKAGFNTEQVVKFTSLMTQTAAALSVPMDQLGQEIRSILEGTIDSNSRVAKALGISNEKIKELAASGKLFDYLSTKLRAFGDAGDAMGKTLGGVWSNLIDAVQMALGTSLEKSFTSTTAFLMRVMDAIVSIDEEAGTFTFNERIEEALRQVDQAISAVLDRFSGEELIGMLASFVETMGAIAVAVLGFVTALASLWQELGPFAPAIAGIVTQFLLWGTAFKALIGLPLELYRQISGLNAGFATLAGGSLPLFIRNVQESSRHTGLLRTAIASLPNALATISTALAAFSVGWAIGTWLNEIDIVKKAGVSTAHALTMGWLEVKKAWEWMTGGDTAAVVREMEIARQTYASIMDEINGKAKQSSGVRVEEEKKVAAASKSSAATMKRATGDALKEMEKKYKEYADEVKRLQGSMGDDARSLAEELRDMSRSGMSDIKAWQDRKKEAGEFAAAAKKAAEAGKAAFKAGNDEQGKENFKIAAEYADKSRAAYRSLNEEVKNGDQVVISQAQALKTAMAGMREAGALKANIVQQQVQAIEQAKKVLNEQSGGQLDKTVDETKRKMEELAKVIEESGGNWGKVWEAMKASGVDAIDAVNQKAGTQRDQIVAVERDWVKAAESTRGVWIEALDDLGRKIDEATKPRTVTVYTNVVQKQSTGGEVRGYNLGGSIQALAAGGGVRNILGGGALPGFGGGDTVPLWGEAGEFMINKWAALKADKPALRALNAGRLDIAIAELSKRLKDKIGYRFGGFIGSLPAMPAQALASGGAVAAGGGETVTVRLDFGGGTVIPVSSTRTQARALVRELTRMAQRSSQ
jgi:hypothetical protein